MSIGETLAQARSQAGLTITQVSQRTKIREGLIREIEHDDFSECGGDFYARGHIRSIARTVGVDPEPLIQEYDRLWREPDPITDVLALVEESRAQLPAEPEPGPGPMPGASVPPAAAGLQLWQRPLTRRPLPASRQPRRGWVLGMAAVLVVALGVAGYALLSGSGPALSTASSPSRPHGQGKPGEQGSAVPARSPSVTPTPTASPTPAAHTAPPASPAQALAPGSAAAFGTGGAGAGDNTNLAHLAVDASSATAWHTDWYTSPTFGNLYSGTGLLLDMRHQVQITQVRIALGGGAGAALQLRVGYQPTLGSLRPVARAAGAGGQVQLRPRAPARGRYVLIWFTRLPLDQSGSYQASVHNVTVTGRP